MFPWVYGFSWTAGTIIFLGAFFAVVCVIGVTVSTALLRSLRAHRAGHANRIRWHDVFHELLPAERVCRHVFTGEFDDRACERSFDCRVCAEHARRVGNALEHQTAPVTTPEVLEMLGLRFPLDRYYHRGHTWVRVESDGSWTIGLDDFAKQLVGNGAMIVPAGRVGEKIEEHGAAFLLRRQDGSEVRILAPVSAMILNVTADENGLEMRVRPEKAESSLVHLLRGAEVRPWLVSEVERLLRTMNRCGAAAVGTTFADGGVLVSAGEALQGAPGSDWDTVAGEMFLDR